MFTGIVSCCSPVIATKKRQGVIELTLERPKSFQDIKQGDSISVDGVCLTLEKILDHSMIFALAKDTLETTKWDEFSLKNKKMNLELSLKMNDRLGGDFISGHVDGMAEIKEIKKEDENQFLTLKIPSGYLDFLWKKGFIAINGVSFTLHEVTQEGLIRIGIIPETLKRTNLSLVSTGNKVTFEVSFMARAFVNYFKNKGIKHV